MKWIIILFAASAVAYVGEQYQTRFGADHALGPDVIETKTTKMYPARFPEVFIEISEDELIESREFAESDESPARAASDELDPEEYAAHLRAAKEGARWAVLTFANETQKIEMRAAMMRVYEKWIAENNMTSSSYEQVQCSAIEDLLTNHGDDVDDEDFNDAVNGWLMSCP